MGHLLTFKIDACHHFIDILLILKHCINLGLICYSSPLPPDLLKYLVGKFFSTQPQYPLLHLLPLLISPFPHHSHLNRLLRQFLHPFDESSVDQSDAGFFGLYQL